MVMSDRTSHDSTKSTGAGRTSSKDEDVDEMGSWVAVVDLNLPGRQVFQPWYFRSQ